MKRSAPLGAARGQAHRDWNWNIGPPVMRAGVVENLIQGNAGKIGELHFHDRSHALERSADGRADHGVFANRRVQDATRKFFRQSFGGLERATKASANVLSVNENAFVIAQKFRLRFANGFEIRDAHEREEVKGAKNVTRLKREGRCNVVTLLTVLTRPDFVIWASSFNL